MSQAIKKLTRSYIHVPKSKPYTGKTIGHIFNETANSNPDKDMYIFYADKERKTYRQMQEESQQFASSLLKLGIKKGDTLGVWGGNHYEWLLAYLASLQIGVIVVHMRTDFPVAVQQQILKKLGITVLVLMRSPPDLLDKVCQIVPELLTNSSSNPNFQSMPMLKYVINAGNQKSRGVFSLTDFMDIGNAVDRTKVMDACQKVDFDDKIVVYFTSGSTGFPKGVTHTNKSLTIFKDFTNCFSKDAQGIPIPWNTRYALVMSFGGVGAQIGALNPVFEALTTIVVAPSYNKELLANAIQKERVTGVLLLIHHLNDLLNLSNFNDYDFSSLKLCFTGGSIIPRSLRDKASAITKHIYLEFSGTEGFSAMQAPKDPLELLEASAYYPSEGNEVKIIGEDEQILPINTAGEICFRSGTLFLHYWGEEEKTKAAKRPSGWYHTGDIGTLDENGYLRIVGRKAEQIIKEGHNINPGVLEKVLDEHPAVHNVMVVGVPDERTSEEVCACIRLNSSASVTTEELRDFCKEKVSDLLVPKYVLIMEDPFPTTDTGKFHRKTIAEQAKSILGL